MNRTWLILWRRASSLLFLHSLETMMYSTCRCSLLFQPLKPKVSIVCAFAFRISLNFINNYNFHKHWMTNNVLLVYILKRCTFIVLGEYSLQFRQCGRSASSTSNLLDGLFWSGASGGSSVSFQVEMCERNPHSYLGAGDEPLPWIYFAFSALYFLLAFIWLVVLIRSPCARVVAWTIASRGCCGECFLLCWNTYSILSYLTNWNSNNLVDGQTSRMLPFFYIAF